uniref:Secreted protein n=1 Tax=Ditylenchus dipsaci TaxID=166011 RepID=A0A915CQ60_9BILA
MQSFKTFLALDVFIAVLLIGQVTALGSNTCTNTTFEAAQKVFVQRLGLSIDDYSWKDAPKFASMIFDVYAKRNMIIGNYPEEISFVTVCRAYNSMIQSLNDSNINWNSCLQQVFLLQSDVDPVNGKIFAGVFNLIQKQCGPLFYPIVSNWDSCVSLIYNASNGASCFNWTPDVQSDKAICTSTMQSAACLQKSFLTDVELLRPIYCLSMQSGALHWSFI